MTDIDDALAGTTPEPVTATTTATPRKHRHEWVVVPRTRWEPPAGDDLTMCRLCGIVKDDTRSRRGRNNRKRGNAAELDVARGVGGRKVGPLGHPWDVEMPGYCRLQVKKLATPPSLRFICDELARIARAPGEEMPGFVWVEPGRDGERLIVFRLRDFAERHGMPTEEAA